MIAVPPLTELCLKNLNSLSSLGLIDMDEDINIKPTGRDESSLNGWQNAQCAPTKFPLIVLSHVQWHG